MECYARNPHSLAATWASDVLGVLTHLIIPAPNSKRANSPRKIWPISGNQCGPGRLGAGGLGDRPGPGAAICGAYSENEEPGRRFELAEFSDN
jgi:hypothetical protein